MCSTGLVLLKLALAIAQRRRELRSAVVGGSSAVNGMFLDRGSASDYDA